MDSRTKQFVLIVVAFLGAPIFIVALGQSPAQPVKRLNYAHAHNDYEHTRPLLDALDQGFTSIEADVYLVDGKLLVAHDFLNISKDRSLEGLYLEPLQKRIQANQGRVYPDGPSLTLLVDIKRDGDAAYRVLDKTLGKYSDIISQTVDGRYIDKAVTVIISGDRPIAAISASNPRFAGIDGRISDIGSDESADLIPLISDNWGIHFKYRGKGELSDDERAKLKDIIDRSHAKGRRVRFWATPESESLWNELRGAGVDLIGTDDLKKLAVFLNSLELGK